MDNKSPRIESRWLANHIIEYSSRAIASKVSELVHSGEIAIGSYLPSTRELAAQLSMSPAAISLAWGMLRKQRMISGSGRNGVWICGHSGPRPDRAEVHTKNEEIEIVNLRWSKPDPTLSHPLIRVAGGMACRV